MFSTPVPDITNLNARITDAFATITEDMLENTWRETDYTDIQPKISIDEISLLWLFCGC